MQTVLGFRVQGSVSDLDLSQAQYAWHDTHRIPFEELHSCQTCRVGDGDCGSTVARGATEIKDALQSKMPLNDAARLARWVDSRRV